MTINAGKLSGNSTRARSHLMREKRTILPGSTSLTLTSSKDRTSMKLSSQTTLTSKPSLFLTGRIAGSFKMTQKLPFPLGIRSLRKNGRRIFVTLILFILRSGLLFTGVLNMDWRLLSLGADWIRCGFQRTHLTCAQTIPKNWANCT
jgi:hypothetical protein